MAARIQASFILSRGEFAKRLARARVVPFAETQGELVANGEFGIVNNWRSAQLALCEAPAARARLRREARRSTATPFARRT